MSLYAGTIYGWLFFGLVVLGMMINASRRQKIGYEMPRGPVHSIFESASYKPHVSETVLARMKELKELRAANLISEAEYEEKRAEILKSL
jgi:hypothetical protein